jgi:hypothetical protein
MKTPVLGVVSFLALLSVSFAAQKPTVYTGEIMDSQCATVGSHDKLIDSGQMKNAEKCTLGCVKNGATFVLVDVDSRVA